MNIFVGNLNYQTTENHLQDLFAEFGAVSSVKIVIDKFTNRARGFAFVEMTEKADGERAIERLNGVYLDQKTLVVNEARPREERSSSYSGRDRNSSRRY
jgi:RNA recognition motif-containing protein